jgi:acetyl-CoA C-acetyltransferase
MKNIYIVDGIRTAVGSFNGTLASKSAVDLGVIVTKELLKRNSLNPENVDETIFGCVLQAGIGQNVARQISIHSGIPKEKTAMTVNMVCGSGLRSIVTAAQIINADDANLIIAGGTESMSNAPYLLKSLRWGAKMGNQEVIDSMLFDGLTDVFNNYHMGITAENLVEKYKLTRQELDEFAAESQKRAEMAITQGKFVDEIVPVEIPQKKKDPIIFKQDEYPRFGTTLEALSKLPPAFKKDGAVTAGNSSGINDGSAAVIVADEDAIKKYNLQPKFKIVSYGYYGTDPSIMGIGPVEAVRLALKKANWKLDDVELIEANEAFAAQSLAVMKELNLNPAITNVNGGAIALGHPIGASGTRILVTLMYEMKRRNAKKGLATLCIGGGMGIAICIENI